MEVTDNTAVTENPIALLVIDVQQGLFRKPIPVHRADELLKNINTLVGRAHASDVPVFYVQHSNAKHLVRGSADWQLHAQLQPQNRDHVIHKQHGDAFEDTPLEETLRSLHVDTVVITGLVTHGCVKATCIGAQEAGFNVILVQDGHSSYNKDAADLIEKWNERLSARQVAVRPTSDITFG